MIEQDQKQKAPPHGNTLFGMGAALFIVLGSLALHLFLFAPFVGHSQLITKSGEHTFFLYWSGVFRGTLLSLGPVGLSLVLCWLVILLLIGVFVFRLCKKQTGGFFLWILAATLFNLFVLALLTFSLSLYETWHAVDKSSSDQAARLLMEFLGISFLPILLGSAMVIFCLLTIFALKAIFCVVTGRVKKSSIFLGALAAASWLALIWYTSSLSGSLVFHFLPALAVFAFFLTLPPSENRQEDHPKESNVSLFLGVMGLLFAVALWMMVDAVVLWEFFSAMAKASPDQASKLSAVLDWTERMTPHAPWFGLAAFLLLLFPIVQHLQRGFRSSSSWMASAATVFLISLLLVGASVYTISLVPFERLILEQYKRSEPQAHRLQQTSEKSKASHNTQKMPRYPESKLSFFYALALFYQNNPTTGPSIGGPVLRVEKHKLRNRKAEANADAESKEPKSFDALLSSLRQEAAFQQKIRKYNPSIGTSWQKISLLVDGDAPYSSVKKAASLAYCVGFRRPTVLLSHIRILRYKNTKVKVREFGRPKHFVFQPSLLCGAPQPPMNERQKRENALLIFIEEKKATLFTIRPTDGAIIASSPSSLDKIAATTHSLALTRRKMGYDDSPVFVAFSDNMPFSTAVENYKFIQKNLRQLIVFSSFDPAKAVVQETKRPSPTSPQP